MSNPAGSTSVQSPPEFNEQTNYLPVRRVVVIFLSMATVDLVTLIDQTTLAVALPIIAAELNSERLSAWVVSSYFLTSTSFQLMYGRLSDIWSRKYILLLGLFIFFIGSLCASLATTTWQLIIFRGFTGIGGGGIFSIAQMIISDIVPLRQRGKYQGIMGAVNVLSNGVGPVLGGAIASRGFGSWRWIFRLNLLLACISAIFIIFITPLRKVEGHWRRKLAAIDFFGVLLALVSSFLLVLGIIWAGAEYPWNSPQVLGTIIGGFATGVAFVLWQWKGARLPILPLSIFRTRLVNGAIITIFVSGWNTLVQLYYIPSFYQLVYGYSPVRSGLLLLPLTVAGTVFSTIGGVIVAWTGRYRECILIGWALWAVSLGLFSSLSESSSVSKQVSYAVLIGVGLGFTMQPALIAIQAGVARFEMAVVTGVRSFARNLSGTLGVAVANTIIINLFKSKLKYIPGLTARDIRELARKPRQGLKEFRHTIAQHSNFSDQAIASIESEILQSYRSSFRVVFMISAGLATIGFFAALFLMPQVSLSRPDEDQYKQKGKAITNNEKSSPPYDKEKATDSAV